jgi:Flp pilus assembly protein TadD
MPWGLIFPLLIVAIGVLTFWNSLHAPFIWDDQTAISTNQTIHQFLPLPGPLAPPAETPVAGRPVVNLSLAVNYAIGTLSETGYHVVNVSVHVLCALLLFGVVRRTLSGRRAPARSDVAAASTAFVVAVLWLVHPLQSEVVDYVTQRSESLMAFFFLLTLYGSIRARQENAATSRRERRARRMRWQAASIVACACGMASKESMVVAPLVVVLYDWTFEFDSLGDAFSKRWAFYAGLASTWAILATLAWNARSTVGASATVGPWIYLLNQLQMVVRYLRLSVWPDALVLDYGLPRLLTVRDVWAQAIVLVALLTGTVVALLRWPRAGFLAAVFFLTLAPTSSVVPIVSEVGAERRMYLPLAALATLAVVGGQWVLARRPSTTTVRYITAGLTVAVIAGLAVRTAARNAEYSSPLTLWTTNVDRFPHGRARMALATELVEAGEHAKAVAVLREAVRDFPDARAALGTELIVQGQTDEGIEVLRDFIAADPSRPNRIPAHALLAQTFMTQRNLDGVEQEFRAIVKLSPSDRGAHTQLARTLLAQAQDRFGRGDAPGAQRYAREAVQLLPEAADAHNLLGASLALSGDLAGAVAEFREAVRLAPGDTQAQANLDRALRIISTSPPRPRTGEPGPR